MQVTESIWNEYHKAGRENYARQEALQVLFSLTKEGGFF